MNTRRLRLPWADRLVGLLVLAVLLMLAVVGFGATAATQREPRAQNAADNPREFRVLRVGTWQGIPGDFDSIQAAVDAAQPGDWVLIGPGVYHPRANEGRAGVFVNTPDIHIRGMDRNRVIIDGTLPGAGEPCSSEAELQNLGPEDENGEPEGRHGIWVRKVSGVTIENLTVCNFLTGSKRRGNQIYWDGRPDALTPYGGSEDELDFFMSSWQGAYLSTTVTFYGEGEDPPRGEYGIFVQRSLGPGRLEHAYGSNMGDAGFYIGGCPDCNAVVDDFHAENNAAGYSGTNAGGRLIVQNSEWNDNKAGIVPNSLNTDPPPPQDGACPEGVTGPTGTDRCTVFSNNFVHHNNNPDVPQAPGVEPGRV